MTPEEIKARNDADEQVQQSINSEEPETSGIRPPPQIESSEQVLEGAIFGFEFAGQPTATAEPGASTPPPPEGDTGACCVEGDCSMLSEEDCIAANGAYRGDGSDCDPNPCCCYFVVSGTGVGEIDDVPFSCTLSETIVAFDNPCCTTLGSGFVVNSDCDDPDEPPGSLQVIGSVIFDSTYPGEWELQLQVGAFGNIFDTLNIGDSCVGGPLTVSGDAFPPTSTNSAFYTGSVQSFFGDCA